MNHDFEDFYLFYGSGYIRSIFHGGDLMLVKYVGGNCMLAKISMLVKNFVHYTYVQYTITIESVPSLFEKDTIFRLKVYIMCNLYTEQYLMTALKFRVAQTLFRLNSKMNSKFEWIFHRTNLKIVEK